MQEEKFPVLLALLQNMWLSISFYGDTSLEKIIPKKKRIIQDWEFIM